MPASSPDDSLPRPRGRPKDPERRAAIIAAGRRLFLEHGTEAVSMDAIADAANVSKRTIYSHFADKQALFQAVILAEMGDYQHPPGESAPRDLAELRRTLVSFGCQLLGLLTQPGILALGRLIMGEATRHPQLVQWFEQMGPQATHLRMVALLEQATQAGLLRCELAHEAAEQILSLWTGILRRHQLGVESDLPPEQIQRHVESCVAMFLRAYRPEAFTLPEPGR